MSMGQEERDMRNEVKDKLNVLASEQDGKKEKTKAAWRGYTLWWWDVKWDCITDQGNILLYVGTVGQIGENGIHVLDISDGDSQAGKPWQRSDFVLILSETKKQKRTQYTFNSANAILLTETKFWYCMCADRSVDGELVGCCRLIVQSSGHSDSASGAINGKKGRRWLKGEENTAPSALVWIGGVYHEYGSAHRCVLKDASKKTHREVNIYKQQPKCMQEDISYNYI